MPSAGSKRIVLVTDEVLGLTRNAGAATANTFLAFALADLGHQVKVLYPAPLGPEGLSETWAWEYERRGIRIQGVEPLLHPVSPATATVTCAVEEALRDDPPDLVIADDRYGSCYACARTRSLGIGFPDTLFAIYCHGTTAWISEAHRKIRRWPASFEVEALERATIALADVVVSPSDYMIKWMRDRGWRLPNVAVVPLLIRSALESRPMSPHAEAGRIRFVAFFGRLEDRKGLRPFIEALNRLDAERLAGIELLFVGKETASWNVARVRAALAPSVEASLAGLRFETELDQPEALELLKRPGTLAVMPSLVDNSPMVIYECLEHGIPFLASSTGGGPELVAAENRERSFVAPTAEALSHALTALLSAPEGSSAARPGFDPDQALSAWQGVIAASPTPRARPLPAGPVSAIVLRSGPPEDLTRCLRALAQQTRPPDEIVVVQSDGEVHLKFEATPYEQVSVPGSSRSWGARETGLRATTGDLILFLEDGDEADVDCVETLLRAQSSSGADVVTCGLRSSDSSKRLNLFLGEPGELGVMANHYGLVGLYRRAVFQQLEDVRSTEGDADWIVLASLSQAGCRIVSVPRDLVRSPRSAGNAASDPAVALDVVHVFERALPPQLRGLPSLAASLGAHAVETPASPSLTERMRWILANEGAAGLLRRAKERTSWRRRAASRVSAPATVSEREPPGGIAAAARSQPLLEGTASERAESSSAIR